MLGFLGLKEIDGTDITHGLQAAVRLDGASRVVGTLIRQEDSLRNVLYYSSNFKFSLNFLC